VAARPAIVRFYIDADVLGLAKILVTIRSDVTYPGDPGGVVHRRQRPACPITTADTPDEIWIPEPPAASGSLSPGTVASNTTELR
jgi:hypothetical protein